MSYRKQLKKIRDFEKLKDNWDSYRSKKISKDVIENTFMIYKFFCFDLSEKEEPFVAPCSGNLIIIEWDRMCIEIQSQRIVIYNYDILTDIQLIAKGE